MPGPPFGPTRSLRLTLKVLRRPVTGILDAQLATWRWMCPPEAALTSLIISIGSGRALCKVPFNFTADRCRRATRYSAASPSTCPN